MFGKPLTDPITKEEQFREVSKILAIALNRIHKAAKGKPVVPVETRKCTLGDNPESRTDKRQ